MASRSAPSSRPKNPNLLVLDREFDTQSVDPMFLEPEGGLAWYNSKSESLELVLGVQSPYEAAESIEYLLGKAHAPFKPARINAQFTYLGGGFGGRDHTSFTFYVALAAMFFPGRPVRLAHDRYQQFQGGIKRHAFKMRSRIGVDRDHRQDHGLCRRPCARRRWPRQSFGPGRNRCCDRGNWHLRHSEGRRDHDRPAFARRHRGIDALLRNAAGDDRARGPD